MELREVSEHWERLAGFQNTKLNEQMEYWQLTHISVTSHTQQETTDGTWAATINHEGESGDRKSNGNVK